MIKILISDDSPTDRAILKSIFESDPDISVIACARDGAEAVEMVKQYQPDLVTMDIKMPHVGGYQAIAAIMASTPVPIVVISSMINDSEADATFLSLDAGALTVLPKPVNILSPEFQATARYMIDTIKSMAQIKVIRKRSFTAKARLVVQNFKRNNYDLIAIGASIGGPQALKNILSRLPSNFPVPIIAVQHMSQGFIEGFTKWLDTHVDLKVKFAEHDELLEAGVVYFAQDHHHLEVKKINNRYKALLVNGKPVSGFLPSITCLMNSVAAQCGPNAVGVLLTGMGSDGAEGLLAMNKMGAHTIIQDKESCVVFGMAGVAETMGAADAVIELDNMAEYLIRVTSKKYN